MAHPTEKSKSKPKPKPLTIARAISMRDSSRLRSDVTALPALPEPRPPPSLQLQLQPPSSSQSQQTRARHHQHHPITSYRTLALLVAINLALFLAFLNLTILGTAIPRITEDFNNHSLAEAGWYGSAYLGATAAFQGTWGRVYKMYSSSSSSSSWIKWTFVAAMGVFGVGNLVCGVAERSLVLIVGRSVAGVGAAGVVSGCYAILAVVVDEGLVPAALDCLGAGYAVATVLGPVLGGTFTDHVSWRWCFYINLPLGGLSVLILLFVFKPLAMAEPQPASAREKLLQLDLLGSTLLVSSLTCLLLALQWGGVTKPWSSGSVIGALVASGCILLLFIANEYKMGERALLVPRLLRQKTLMLASAYALFSSAAFFILIYYLPFYFQSVRGLSAMQSGIRNLPFVLSVALCSILSGTSVALTGHYTSNQVLGSVLIVVATGLIWTLDEGSGAEKWIGYQVLAGIGIGISFQLPVIVSHRTARTEDVTIAIAICLFFQSMAGAVSISASQSLFANGLMGAVRRNVPALSPQVVLAAGASNIRSHFEADQIWGIVTSYMIGLKEAFAFSIALAGLGLLVAVLNLAWDNRNLKQRMPSRDVGEVVELEG